MTLHATIDRVTDRIRERSIQSRSAYLAKIARAAEEGPRRAHLSCGNQAHAYAAMPDKQDFAETRKPNIGIVTAYNDMLSAHQPYEHYPELIRRANKVFVNCRAFRVFGSSECPMVTQGVLDDPELAATTDGRVFDWEVKVVDAEGNRVAAGSEGEILARGPSLFRGYTSAEANRESFDEEGFFRTGDLGTVTGDGLLTITGRKKDIIIRGGENLSAKEIEDALHEHPAIRETAVVAMPHERLGEGVCAWLVAGGEARPDEAELAAYLSSAGLARQKCPERVEYVEELPKTASGKVKKHELRRMIAQKIEQERQGGRVDA